MLAAWNVSPLTTKIVICFGVLVLWPLIIELRDMGRARRGPAMRIIGKPEDPDWHDEEWNEEETL